MLICKRYMFQVSAVAFSTYIMSHLMENITLFKETPLMCLCKKFIQHIILVL